jgi:Response regulator containing CheY-like receiver domain and AraC-type DNA-binding domain
VDDEVFVQTLIEKIVDWEKLNMGVVGKASNGMEALMQINDLKPDIVLLDVSMPGYDGITLMQKVRETNKNVKFIIISGHKSFEHAKNAMQYNVEDYILKPISKKELESILIKLKNKIEEEYVMKDTFQIMDIQLEERTKKIRSLFLSQFIKKEINLEKIILANINNNYYTTFQDGKFNFSILKVDTDEKNVNEGFLYDLLNKIADRFVKEANFLCFETLCLTVNNKIIFFFNYNPVMKEKLYSVFKEQFVLTKNELIKFSNIYITLCHGEEEEELGNCYRSFNKAETSMKGRTSLGVNKIIKYNKLEFDTDIKFVIMTDKKCEELLTVLKSFNIEKIRNCILDIFNIANIYKEKSSLIYYQLCDEIYKIFYEFTNQNELYKGSYDDLIQKLKDQLEECFTGDDIAHSLINLIVECLEQYYSLNSNNENPLIRLAKRYIFENYDKLITLESISRIVNLNPVYFSVLFKKEVGISFVEYLNQYRIGIAKKILKDVKYNINQIASLSGYQDTRYFSKIFKKYTGITPTEYRTRHIQ